MQFESKYKVNKITFKRTRSLSNAACFKHDNNICACAVSALILLPVVNLSLEIDSMTSISYTTWKVSPSFCSILASFQYACAVSTILLVPVKIWRHIWIQRVRFSCGSKRLTENWFSDIDFLLSVANLLTLTSLSSPRRISSQNTSTASSLCRTTRYYDETENDVAVAESRYTYDRHWRPPYGTSQATTVHMNFCRLVSVTHSSVRFIIRRAPSTLLTRCLRTLRRASKSCLWQAELTFIPN